MKVKDIMTREVITVRTEVTINEIARILVENKISGVPVVDAAGLLVGIVSEGDLLHKETSPRIPDFINILGAIIFYNGVQRYNEDFKKLVAKQACDIMTEKVVVVSEEAEVQKVAELMLQHGINRVPVMAGDKIAGIISRADIIKILVN